VPIEVINVLVELNPDALVATDDNGDLPIHRACSDLNLSTVPLLVQWNPATLKVANDSGELPLHCICAKVTSYAAPPMLAMIAQLIEEYPDALWTGCEEGYTPIMLVLRAPHEDFDPPTPEFLRFLHRIIERGGSNSILHKFTNCAGETDITSALHLACSYFPNPLLLGTLIGKARCALDMKGKHERLPLHYVCENFTRNMPIVPEAIQLVMEASPSAALDTRDSDGATPLMVAISRMRIPDDGDVPVPGAIPLLKEMFRRAPQSVRGTFEFWHGSGKTTALELACQNRHCADLVSPVMESWPAALCFLNDLLGEISSTVESEARRMFLSLIEVLLHETTRWIVPGAIRERVREAVSKVVDIDCLVERGSFPIVQEIQKTVTGDALGQLRSEILNNDELQQLLQSHESLQDMVTGVYLMNKEGRLGCEGAEDDPDTFSNGRHICVLEAAKDNLSCLFLHLRQCPTLFASRDGALDDEHGDEGAGSPQALQRRGNERLAGFRAGRATRWRAGFAGRDAGARATGPRAGAPRRSAARRVLSWLARCSPRRWFAGEPGRVGVASRPSPFGRRRAKNRSSSVISS
jgi:ankyrin repeat protein